MKKRLISILLIVAILMTFLSFSSFGANNMELNGASYPTVLKQGEAFVARGIITSDCDILKVVIGVYNTSGKAEFEYTGLPGEPRYDINNVDYLLSFSKLPNGTFTYKIVASDEKNSNVVLLNKKFTVSTTGKVSTLKITDGTYPMDYQQGEGYSVKGIITSDYAITKVVIGAYKSDGTVGFEYKDYPNSKSFNIRDVDYSLPFSKLKSGTYTYKVMASDSEVSDVILLQHSFTVTGSAASSTLKITNANYPTTLDSGEGFSVTGIISSNYNISKIVIGAYTSSGAKGFEYTATPGTKSYDISDVDYLLTFSKLSSGTYTYKIVASDSQSSNVTLLNKSFTVNGSSGGNTTLQKVNWDVVDISYWNSDAISSWSKMAQDLDAIILRIGFAYTASKKMEEDDSFSNYYSNAKKYNLPVGVYYFGAATTAAEADKEADFVISLLKKYNCKLEMPVYYDLETEDQVDLTQSECTAVARTFCDKLTKAGYYVGIYCNKYFARDELYASRLSDYHFWIAEYNSRCTYDGAYGMWQYTESGRISGLDRVCDKNYCYYNYPAYIKANGLNGFTKTQVSNPQFSFKTGTNLSVNESAKKVYLKKDPGLTTSQFTSKYVTSKDVTIKFAALSSDSKVATGTTIIAQGNGKTFGPYTICLIGDTTKDSKINSSDALAVLRHAVGTASLSGDSLKAADWNGDGKVNSTDALAILSYSTSR